ncbi:hypothetical protein [Actinomadura oligospora]|uniref:hypothetical protein n=1 Tax=Actinomadura oligospora TaxID=111804 RepID=UPI00047B70EA|nr:hypothetical protein [Actinomadura oligospora]
MTTDIHGFFECRMRSDPLDRWRGVLELRDVYGGRSDPAFGCLFGVRERLGFRPVAGGRGLPLDASPQTRAAQHEGLSGHTWIGWQELAGIDWDEPSERPDSRVRHYRRRDDGTLELVGTYLWDTPFTGRVDVAESEGGAADWTERREWTDGSTVYRADRARRRDAIDDTTWNPVWRIMEVLADVHGPAAVRLVVWFG